jgi:arginyl-tRNA synthetase
MMRFEVISALKITGLSWEEIEKMIGVPQDNNRGDYALPCFALAKIWKKNPVEIAKEIAFKLKNESGFEKIEAVGPYVNFFVDKKKLALEVLKKVEKLKNNYGSNNTGKGKNIVIDMSSPNIAKPFGIGHLRSTIIGNSIAHISEFNGYSPVKINYLGDWGTQFGKMIVGYKRIGNLADLRKNPMPYMFKLYVEGNKEEYEQDARDWFKKLEVGNKEALKLWKLFRDISLKNFNQIYKTLGIKFSVVSGESMYEQKMKSVFNELEKKKLLQRDDGALIVDLNKHNLGVALIEKSDGTKLYVTRDLAAAIERYSKYNPSKMFYEVGQEQKLHFKQLFKILELMGHSWSKDCFHVDHGLYLDQDGKKFATRKGRTIFMEDVLNETISIAKEEIKKREKLSEKEINQRARAIAVAAIFYGDLKNYRNHDIVFDIDKFISFEGDTGPYLLYSYARANSILKKVKNNEKKIEFTNISESEKKIIVQISSFPEVVKKAYDQVFPNLVANYAYNLSQTFNEFYHSCQVIGSDEEGFRLRIVKAFAQTLKNALKLLGIPVIKEM